jgi:hypothetical protein
MYLEAGNLLEFNSVKIILDSNKVLFCQKGQTAKIKPVGIKDYAQKYIK